MGMHPVHGLLHHFLYGAGGHEGGDLDGRDSVLRSLGGRAADLLHRAPSRERRRRSRLPDGARGRPAAAVQLLHRSARADFILGLHHRRLDFMRGAADHGPGRAAAAVHHKIGGGLPAVCHIAIDPRGSYHVALVADRDRSVCLLPR